MFLLFIKPEYDIEEILELLDDEVLFSSEEPGKLAEVAVRWKEPKEYPFIQSCEPYQLPPIDWEGQWEIHGPGYIDGFLEVPVGETILKLKAGPGFGNLSHPTTCLMLEMMKDLVKDRTVADIGTGSGILAMYAKAMGATKVIGIDIDPEAVKHAEENTLLNHLAVDYFLPTDAFEKNFDVILINMIFEEQKVALKDWGNINHTVIVSGLLIDQKASYLDFAKDRGWVLTHELSQNEWLALAFSCQKD